MTKRINLTPVAKDGPNLGLILNTWMRNTTIAGQGMTLGEMQDRLALAALFVEAKEEPYIDVSTEQYAEIKKIVENVRFNIADETLVELGDRVLKAEAPPKESNQRRGRKVIENRETQEAE